ncbi:hypothetical protein BC629DRAFT_1434705 [Irpex lacteus]|nr:hypothetical protein BC629DRAFT_1434705 [Irpex lacteus]
MGDRRYVHAIDLTQNADPQRYDIGQRQRQCALERYHYLCAAIQEAYTLHRGQLFVRDELDFDRYPAYALESVSAKLHPRPDGTIHPGDIKLYVDGMVKNYKCSEGGIMYCVGDSRPFWNMVINYHSSAGTTGIKAWDRLFRKLKTSGYDKGFFFATPFGCNDPACPFLHNREKSVQARERILARRRTTLGKPTPRDIAAREKIARKAYEASQRQVVLHQGSTAANEDLSLLDDDDDDDLDPELMKIYEESAKIKAICNNPACLKAKMKGGTGNEDTTPVTLKSCTQCKTAMYCSRECQKADWQRHKKEPCRPFEQLVEDDTSLRDQSGDGLAALQAVALQASSCIMVEASVEVMMGFASGRGKQRAALQADKMSTAATKKKDNFWDDMLNEVMVQDLYKQPTRTVAATVDKKDKFWDDVLIEVMEHDLNLNKQTSKAVPVVATNEKELMRQDRYKQPTQVAASTAKKDKFWDDVLAEVMAKDLGLDKWPTQRPSTSEAEIERQKRRQEQKEAEEQQRWNDNQRYTEDTGREAACG